MSEYEDYLPEESKNEKKSLGVSIGLHLLLLLLCFYPFMNYLYPPQLQGGITIVFGDIDGEQDADFANNSDSQSSSESSDASSAKVETTATPIPVESPVVRNESKKENTNSNSNKDTKTTDNTNNNNTPTEKKSNQFSDLFGNSGNSSQAPKGDPQGNPDSRELENLAKGSDKVGGGLKGRGVVFEPQIKDNSQKTGRVVVEVCVDRNGSVISSRFTQRGSTTADDYLIKLAEQNASKYKFAPGESERQCGTITMDFRLQ